MKTGQTLSKKIRSILKENFYLPAPHPSPFPSPLVANPNPAGDIIPVMTWKSNNKPHTDESRRISCSRGAIVTLWIEYGKLRGPASAGAMRKLSVNVPVMTQMAMHLLSLIRRRAFSTYRRLGSILAVLIYWLLCENVSAFTKDL